MAVCAIVSFRLGTADGVSVVAATWHRALGDLGFEMVRSPAKGPVDITVDGMAIDVRGRAEYRRAEAALTGVDIVVVENCLVDTAEPFASRALAASCEEGPRFSTTTDPHGSAASASRNI